MLVCILYTISISIRPLYYPLDFVLLLFYRTDNLLCNPFFSFVVAESIVLLLGLSDNAIYL